MIISKKKLDKMIEDAVQNAIEETHRYRDVIEEKREAEYRINQDFKEVWDQMTELNRRISSVDEELTRRIFDLECKVSHKKKA